MDATSTAPTSTSVPPSLSVALSMATSALGRSSYIPISNAASSVPLSMNAAQRSAGSYPSPTKAVIPSRAAIDKSSSSAGTSPTIVALAILCGVLGLALGVTLFLLLARRRNRRVIEAHLDAERAQRARAESELESEPTNPTVPPLVSEMKKQMGAYNLPPYSPGSNPFADGEVDYKSESSTL